MRCLMCGTEKEASGRFTEVLFSEDPLCLSCRRQWKRYPGRLYVQGIRADVIWAYEGGYRQALLQYKECCDEALKDVFLYPDIFRLKMRYRGWTLAFLPSTKQKQAVRGFDHLEKMFACLGLKCISPFEKTVQQEQKLISRIGRRKMIHGIVLKEGVSLPEKIVLADDVITTGSTIKGALAALDTHDVRIRILAAGAAVPPAENRHRRNIVKL